MKLLSTLMAFILIGGMAMACPPEGSAEVEKKAEAETTENVEVVFAKLNLSVDGMTCGGCENKVKAALTGIDGVVETHKVCSESDKASLTYDPNVTSEEEIIAQLGDKTGYAIAVIKSAAKTEAGEAKSAEAKAACAAKKAEAKASCSKSKASADKELKEEE